MCTPFFRATGVPNRQVFSAARVPTQAIAAGVTWRTKRAGTALHGLRFLSHRQRLTGMPVIRQLFTMGDAHANGTFPFPLSMDLRRAWRKQLGVAC